MTLKKNRKTTLAVSVAAVLATVTALGEAVAEAQTRESPLVGQPAVRQRLLLRKYRFEITPMVGFQFLGEFNTAIMPGAKLAFHFNDWIAVQAFGLYGVTVNSGLNGQIEEVYRRNSMLPEGRCQGSQFLNCQPVTDPESALGGSNDPVAFRNRLARVNGHFGGGVSLSPFFGKMALFGRVFFQYDIYALVGVGIVSYTNSYNGVGTDPQNSGAKVGPNFGAGLHLFVNNWLAINFEFRDSIVRNNVSGGDTNGDFRVNGDDAKTRNEFIGLLGVAFYLPARVDVSP